MEKVARVFGIGISRTGTTSLTRALCCLDYKAIHAPLSILKHVDGKLVLNKKAAMRYEAITDSPAAFLYKELDAAFPGAKFILTVRDVEKWLISMQRIRRIYPILRLVPKVSQLLGEVLGESNLTDEEKMRIKFLQHTREVLDHFKGRNNLLVMNFATGDGWEKLCSFLGQPMPDVPFPHSNRKTVISWSNAWDAFKGFV